MQNKRLTGDAMCCEMMDCPSAPPGRAALTIALCAACLGCATACAAAPKLMYIIPMIATAVWRSISSAMDIMRLVYSG